MNARRVGALVLRQGYLLKSSPVRVLPIFAWVLIDIVLWGYITKYLHTISSPGFSLVTAFLGAILLWDLFTRVMHGLASAFFEDVWSRNFLNYFSSPLTIIEYLSGLILTSMATSSLALVAMLLVASALFGLSFMAYGFMAIPFLLILVLFGVALGILGCGVVLRYGPAAEWLIWPLPALLSPFVGVFYPVSTLPMWMQMVAAFLPASYVFEALRTIVAGGTAQASQLAIGVLLAVMYVLLAVWCFSRIYRTALRLGLVPRYSAESTG
ncbi:MAG: ABC transporter permease [Bdellovibrionota bacterium]|nr:MAG: ABC transporter permease [Bdellovibrionota bacterium]